MDEILVAKPDLEPARSHGAAQQRSRRLSVLPCTRLRAPRALLSKSRTVISYLRARSSDRIEIWHMLSATFLAMVALIPDRAAAVAWNAARKIFAQPPPQLAIRNPTMSWETFLADVEAKESQLVAAAEAEGASLLARAKAAADAFVLEHLGVHLSTLGTEATVLYENFKTAQAADTPKGWAQFLTTEAERANLVAKQAEAWSAQLAAAGITPATIVIAAATAHPTEPPQ